MSIQTIKQQIPDHAKDIKLNFGSVLSEEGAPGLSHDQIQGVALACAYTTENVQLIDALNNEFHDLGDPMRTAAQGAVAVMAMNNVYYRFVHLVNSADYQKMPAGLRMNLIGNPGVEKIDFELMCLAVSAMNGCGLCIDSHVKVLERAGLSQQGVQSSVRIAAVIQAVAKVLTLNAMPTTLDA